MNTLTISPMQHISPPPCLFAILLQLQLVKLVGHQAAPAIHLLGGEIIIHVDVVLAEAAAMMKHDMLGLSVIKLETPNCMRRAACPDGLQSSADHWHCI